MGILVGLITGSRQANTKTEVISQLIVVSHQFYVIASRYIVSIAQDGMENSILCFILFFSHVSVVWVSLWDIVKIQIVHT